MLELWGGHEPTIRRVNDEYIDQTAIQGHYDRITDLDLFASVGFQSIRYPILWEHYEKHGWDFADERLERIRTLGINPIVGLLHHGSGPPSTNLLESGFPRSLANYARQVAERFPWVTDYTPVNEPLTTARFSCLYGVWYPHTRDEKSKWIALLNQLEATILSMQEIRKVNPDARLIQTDDLGKITSTPELAHQAEYENNRRWITWDILSGKFDQTHPLADEFDQYGLLDWALRLAQSNCPPSIIGIDYYLTSDRFLDHRMHNYPEHLHGECQYVDVETCRVSNAEIAGIKSLLHEAWNRYQIPLAITEVHNGSPDIDERLRWMYEAWTSAQEAQSEGVDIRAVTSWATLGSYDWNSLLVNMTGHYEPGAWDVSSGTPVPTDMVKLLMYLRGHPDEIHPSLNEMGWWRRNDRYFYFPEGSPL